jgi:cell division septation protein DedD
VLAALLVAAVAAGVAIAATNDNGSKRDTKAAVNETVPAATGESPPPPASTETGPEPTSSVPTSTTPTEPQPEPPPPPASGGELIEWPGQNGWTIVLASVPQSSGRAAAVREARKASNAGLTDVGVLNSSDYSSLHSGYFVVFSGVFTSEKEARSSLDTAKGSYPQAYARQIVQ